MQQCGDENTKPTASVSKISSKQIIFDQSQTVDVDFIRQCILKRESFKAKQKESLISINGSIKEDDYFDNMEEDNFFSLSKIPSIHFGCLQQAKQMLQEAEVHSNAKNNEQALKLYMGALILVESNIKSAEYLEVYTTSKLNIASLYLMSHKYIEAEHELNELMSANEDCPQAYFLMSQLKSHAQ